MAKYLTTAEVAEMLRAPVETVRYLSLIHI